MSNDGPLLGPFFYKEKHMNLLKLCLITSVLFGFQICANQSVSQQTVPQTASDATLEYQKTVKNTLPFADVRDFELAEKGLIKRP